MVFQLVRFVEIRNGRRGSFSFKSRFRNVAVFSGLLSDGPDDVHLLVEDLVVRELVGLQLLAEDDRRLAVTLKTQGGRDVISSAPKRVASRSRP